MQAGKIRYYGVSVEKVAAALRAIEYPNVQTVQIIFNCFRQRPADLFFARAKERKVGILRVFPWLVVCSRASFDKIPLSLPMIIVISTGMGKLLT